MSGNVAEVQAHKRTRSLSRIGRKPVPVPTGVDLSFKPGEVTAKGPKGALTQVLPLQVKVEVADSTVQVSRLSDSNLHSALHGLTRSLIANAIEGVTKGYEKVLDLHGVGYRVQQSGPGVTLVVGLSHQVNLKPLLGVTLTVEGQNRIHVTGVDKQKVGEMAASIRRVRPLNAYKDKGIIYSGEQIRFKAGKSAGRKTQ